ncbi:MAG TPA: hypothetical protein VMV03_03255 [Spirochaetia bacterium]|nr:hypothetical protein [Spirochaetia bacterium]
MKSRYAFAAVLAGLLVLPGLLFAQAAPATAKPAAISVTLSYHEDNSGTFRVMADRTTEVTGIQDGDELKPGWTVVTGAGDVAELKINHTGTIIKISQNTNFTVQGLRTQSGGQDVFSLGVGKARTVAGRASGKDQYQIRTQSAVCGVRGSDVVVEFLEGTTSKLYTLEGTGWMQDIQTGKELEVSQGFMADALAPAFQPVQIPKDVLTGLEQEMTFVRLDPNQAIQQEKQYLQEQEQSQAPAQQSPPAPQQNSFLDNVFTALHDIVGFEIGSITIDGVTYGKVIIEPTFTFGKLKTALYLPIIYKQNMLDPGDWYHPLGNDEWSFGRDQGGDTGKTIQDIGRDLILKIKYIEYGRQRDPFFFKAGNLEDITIGHGLIMRNYANDADFPAVRRIGLNVGADLSGGGFEAMVNDAADPDVVGGRLYVRPIPGFRAALGVSALVDFNPARDFPGGPDSVGAPIFINPGVDFDLPFVESDAFGLIFFTDGAVMLPYFRSSYLSIKQGLVMNAVYDPSSSMPVKNWGAAAGFFGNLFIPDFTWRVEYRYFTGIFQPQFYDSGYERLRPQYVATAVQYLLNTANPAFNMYRMGIYGEAGFKLNRIFSVQLGYFWPWTIDPATGHAGPDPANPDHFIASFVLNKGVIPVVNIWGSVSYERSSLFIGSNLPSNFSDAILSPSTVISARVNYPVSAIMTASLIYTTAPVRNPDGTLHYPSPTSLLPDMATSLSIVLALDL